MVKIFCLFVMICTPVSTGIASAERDYERLFIDSNMLHLKFFHELLNSKSATKESDVLADIEIDYLKVGYTILFTFDDYEKLDTLQAGTLCNFLNYQRIGEFQTQKANTFSKGLDGIRLHLNSRHSELFHLRGIDIELCTPKKNPRIPNFKSIDKQLENVGDIKQTK